LCLALNKITTKKEDFKQQQEQPMEGFDPELLGECVVDDSLGRVYPQDGVRYGSMIVAPGQGVLVGHEDVDNDGKLLPPHVAQVLTSWFEQGRGMVVC
jgi:hypothetical protein